MVETLMQQVLQQAGAIPISVMDGELRVMLVTSLDTGRWLIPKGHVDPGLTPAAAAAKEAYEEAGIKGEFVSETPLGFYTYFKRLKSGTANPATVEVYLIQVSKQCRKWPEMNRGKFAWFSAAEAAKPGQEPSLARLLMHLDEMVLQDEARNHKHAHRAH